MQNKNLAWPLKFTNIDLPDGITHSINCKYINVDFFGVNFEGSDANFEIKLANKSRKTPQLENFTVVGEFNNRNEPHLLQLDIENCFIAPKSFGVLVTKFLDSVKMEDLTTLLDEYNSLKKGANSIDPETGEGLKKSSDIRISEDMYAAYSEQYSATLDLNGNEEPWSDQGLYKFITEELGTEYWEVV